MSGITHRLSLAPLVALLVVQGSLCFCGSACGVQGNATTTVAAESLPASCGCCSENATENASQEEESSCYGCCVESPLAEPPVGESVSLKSFSHVLFELRASGPTVRSVYIASARAEQLEHAPAQGTQALYLRFELLRV